MLQNLGDKLKGNPLFAKIIFAALGITMALWGAYGVVDFSGVGNHAAKVNGEAISLQEVNQAFQSRQSQLLREGAPELTEAQRTALQKQVIDEFVRNEVLRQQAEDLGFRVSDAQLRAAFEAEPAFQVEGKFNAQTAVARLAAAGLTPAGYEAEQRRVLTMTQMLATVANTGFLTKAERERLQALEEEQRELRYALLLPQQFAGTAPPDAAAIEAWYKSHEADYRTTEKVRLAWAELSLFELAGSVQPSEAQLREAYEKNRDSYVAAERRRARHILLTVDKPADEALVKARAEALLKQIRDGADFGKLATENSKDPGSAAQGGDLGFAAREAYVPEFSAALFALQQGQVSEPVKTQFGYHLIKLEAIEGGSSRSFDDVRFELAQSLRQELAAERFGDIQEQLAERTETNRGSFDDLVKEFGLRPAVIDEYLRDAGGGALAGNADVNREVFSDRVLVQKGVGGPIPFGDDRLVIFSVLAHQPAVTRPLAEVRADIERELLRQRGAEAARKAADQALAALGEGKAFAQVAAGLKLAAESPRFVGREDGGLPVQVRDAAFRAPRPAAGKPVQRVVELDGGALAVLQVTAVRASGGEDAAVLPFLRAQREQRERALQGRLETDAYVAALVKQASVKTNPNAFQ
ncbi:MAG: hypothetical protein RL026_1714 [Pseudomonadota bacterium]